MNFEQLDKIAKKYGTPYYLMYGDRYLKNIEAFQHAFKKRYDKLIIGYSFKTNYVPSLCMIAKNFGCYAEVVSEMEYKLAKHIGFEHIIFNGPIKKEDAIFTALKDKAVINLDSYYELQTVLKYKLKNPSEKISVGLRVNIDLVDKKGISKIQNGLRVGRFGFSQFMLEEIVQNLHESGIRIVSLHGHTSSSDRAVANYGYIVTQMLNVCERHKLNDLKYFDVGGGFFGAPAKGLDVSNKPKYSDYANCIMDICLSNGWFNQIKPTIVIEPGVSVVANVFSYVSMIFQIKDIAGQKFLTTDGTVFDVKPTFHEYNLPHTFYSQKNSDKTYTANIVGSTCMEKDVILKGVEIPECIHYGDYLKIDGVGAYTIVLTPTFINFVSPIIGVNDNKTFMVRRRQNIEDVLTLYSL